MAAATFMTDLVEIATQAAEAAAGIASLVEGFKSVEIARGYYDLYAAQRQFYYNVFQAGVEQPLANIVYGEPIHSIDYVGRVGAAYDPISGPFGGASTDVVGWVTRHAAMYATTMDPSITELEVDTTRIRSDWTNYLFRFEELWADTRNDARWAKRMSLHNIGMKQGTAIDTALGNSLSGYQNNIADMASQLATYGNGIAKYAGYKRGLVDTTDAFDRATHFSRDTSNKTMQGAASVMPVYDRVQIGASA